MARDRKRWIELEAGCNMRDLGGYAGSRGLVRWGAVYRSGTPGLLTDKDLSTLAGLGIRVSCDLRSNAERNLRPSRFTALSNVHYWCRDHAEGAGDLSTVLSARGDTEAAGIEIMQAIYRNLPVMHRHSYREIFLRIGQGEVPLVFNCSGGKDRAGMAAALLLEVLGIDRATILQDYLLTNEAADFKRARNVLDDKTERAVSNLRRLSPAVEAILWQADARLLQAAFDRMDERYGSVSVYASEELGIDAAGLDAVRRQLLL